MTQNNNIESTYGKPFSISIANASADVVMHAEGLPKSTIIVSSEYNESTMQDIGNQSIIMTDPNGQPFMLTYDILETNGLHSTTNPNAVSLNIDGVTLQTNEQGQLTFGLGSLIDGTVLSENLNGLSVNSQFIEHATANRYGVVKLDGKTIKEQNGKIYVDTSSLDLATQDTEGIATGDGNTVKMTRGILSVDTQKLQKASYTAYGVAKTDGLTVSSNVGVVSVDMNVIGGLTASSGEKTLKADQTSVVSSNGVLSIDTTKLDKASATSYGVAQIDPNTLYIGNDGSLKVKNYDSMMTYIYDYEEGLDTLEERISYLQNMLSSGTYGSQEPEIRHLTCDQTTTSELVPPTYQQEPINMEMQHVYVSLNVITNCEFKITLDYQDDKNPTTQLDNINFNEEIQKFGVEALDYVWPSTGMKEKRIVLLFNVKNFYSSTEGQTAITKIHISVAAEADNTKEKSILYSIIRYNSAWKEEELEQPEQEEEKDEYYVDERASRWFMIRIKPGENAYNYWDQTSTFDYTSVEDGGYVEKSGPIGGLDENITILVDDVKKAFGDDAEYVFYLKGVYVNRNTGVVNSFFERIPVENFIIFTNFEDEILPRNVYDFEKKVGFDVLYFQIRYSINNPTSVEIHEDPFIADIYKYHPDSTYVDVPIKIGGEVPNPYYMNHSNDEYTWTTYTNGVKYVECVCARLCNNWYDIVNIDSDNNIHLTNSQNHEFCMIDFNRSKTLTDKISVKYNLAEIEDVVENYSDFMSSNNERTIGKLYFYIPTLKATLEERFNENVDNNEAVVSRISAVQKSKYHNMKYDIFGYVGISETDYVENNGEINYTIPYGTLFSQNIYSYMHYRYCDNGVWDDVVDGTPYSELSYKILPVEINIDDLNTSDMYNATYSFNTDRTFNSIVSIPISDDYYVEGSIQNGKIFTVNSKVTYEDTIIKEKNMSTVISYVSIPMMTMSNINIFVDNGALEVQGGNDTVENGFSDLAFDEGSFTLDDLSQKSMCLSYSYSSYEYYAISSNDSFTNFTTIENDNTIESASFILKKYNSNDEFTYSIVNSEESIDVSLDTSGYAIPYMAYVCETNGTDVNVISNVLTYIKKDEFVELSSENTTYFVGNEEIYTYSFITSSDTTNSKDWMYVIDDNKYVIPGVDYKHTNSTQVVARCTYDYSREHDVVQQPIIEAPIVHLSYSSCSYESESGTLTLDIGTYTGNYENVTINTYMTIDTVGTFVGNNITADNGEISAQFTGIDIQESHTFILSIYGEYENEGSHIIYNTSIDEYLLVKSENYLHVEDLQDTASFMDSINIAVANTVSVFGCGMNALKDEYQTMYNMMKEIDIYDNNDLENPIIIIADNLDVFGDLTCTLEEMTVEEFNEYDEDSVTIKVKFENTSPDTERYADGVFIYNIPVIRNLKEKFGVTNYNGFTVPKFCGKFNKYLNPYDYSIDVQYTTDEVEYNGSSLNEPIEVQSATKILFDIKYNGFSITNKNVDIQQMLNDERIRNYGNKVSMVENPDDNFYSYYYRINDTLAVTQVEERFTPLDLVNIGSCIITLEDEIDTTIENFSFNEVSRKMNVIPESVTSYVLYSNSTGDAHIVWDRCSYEYDLGYQYMFSISGINSYIFTPSIAPQYVVNKYVVEQNLIKLENN